jgi:hypothetical protein
LGRTGRTPQVGGEAPQVGGATRRGDQATHRGPGDQATHRGPSDASPGGPVVPVAEKLPATTLRGGRQGSDTHLGPSMEGRVRASRAGRAAQWPTTHIRADYHHATW